MLISGIVGPRPDTGCPRPFEFVRAEFPAVRIAVCHEEPLRFLDGGQLFHADGRIQRGSESGEDSSLSAVTLSQS